MFVINKPLVSVIIPCYNVSDYVLKAIDSIINQTYTNLEIWLIDDASTDNTLEKLKAVKDTRVRLFSSKLNTQKIDAVNEVLQKVTGDLIAFQDADDWSEPTRIEKQVNEFSKQPELGICFTNFIYEGIKEKNPGPVALTNDDLKDEFLYFMKKKNAHLTATCCPSMMISRDALTATRGYNAYFKGRVAEDIQWIYRILKFYKGITINEALYHYTVRGNSLTGLQHAGANAKAAYAWHLLGKIIEQDIQQNVDVFSAENAGLLKRIELEACEEALKEAVAKLNTVKHNYERSWNFRVGKCLLSPFRLFS